MKFYYSYYNFDARKNIQSLFLCIVNKNIYIFFSIGTVRVSYSISSGSVNPLSEDLVAAKPTEDFTAVQGYIDIPDNNVSATVAVQILDDSLPEVDEAFVVTLTGVILVNTTDASSMPPRLGMIIILNFFYHYNS